MGCSLKNETAGEPTVSWCSINGKKLRKLTFNGYYLWSALPNAMLGAIGHGGQVQLAAGGHHIKSYFQMAFGALSTQQTSGKIGFTQ